MEKLRTAFKRDELRDICKKLSISQYGVKSEICERILKHLNEISDNRFDSQPIKQIIQKEVEIEKKPCNCEMGFKAVFKRLIINRPSLTIRNAEDSIGSFIQWLRAVAPQCQSFLTTTAGLYALFRIYMLIFGGEEFSVSVNHNFSFW